MELHWMFQVKKKKRSKTFKVCYCCPFFLQLAFILQIRNYYSFSRNMKETKSVFWSFSRFHPFLFWCCTNDLVWCQYSAWVSYYRSFLWGPAAVEHHKTRKSLGASLWKQTNSDDLLALLKPERMLQTITHFPQQRRIILEVWLFFSCKLHFSQGKSKLYLHKYSLWCLV